MDIDAGRQARTVNDALPAFTPRWNDPQPYDGSSPEEVDAFARLRGVADRLDALAGRLGGAAEGIRAWLTLAYLQGAGPAAWEELETRVAEIGRDCIDFVRTIDSREAGR